MRKLKTNLQILRKSWFSDARSPLFLAPVEASFPLHPNLFLAVNRQPGYRQGTRRASLDCFASSTAVTVTHSVDVQRLKLKNIEKPLIFSTFFDFRHHAGELVPTAALLKMHNQTRHKDRAHLWYLDYPMTVRKLKTNGWILRKSWFSDARSPLFLAPVEASFPLHPNYSRAGGSTSHVKPAVNRQPGFRRRTRRAFASFWKGVSGLSKHYEA